ncbi:techylectin-5A [Caerostris extrusa]|uniref:Techylectin-5A n=1 Tax=Caerostris extrusa TaxID=172846 RepID=A0AAV4M8X7_CAEEX|nr:techylectin-5A [Caerostris extrusa]
MMSIEFPGMTSGGVLDLEPVLILSVFGSVLTYGLLKNKVPSLNDVPLSSFHILSIPGFSQTLGNETPTCDLRARSTSFLDAAVDMISKAKDNFPVCPSVSAKPMDCAEVLRGGRNKSGVYTVWPKNRVAEDKPLDVYCDMDKDGGGWTVIQRRGDFQRSQDYFFKDWASYKKGFGDNEKDFWLGNDNIFALSNQRLYSIRFDLKAVDGEKRYALYDTFWIDDENNKYTLHIQDYSGDAGDSMIAAHNNHKFTTKDQDNDTNDGNCAQTFKGAWWYKSCHESNLNGLNLRGVHKSFADGVNWRAWRGYNESLDTTEMKIRPKSFKKVLIVEETPKDL